MGGAESGEFLRQSRDVAARWGERGARTDYVEVPGANHFTVLHPLADPDSAMTRALAALAQEADRAAGAF